MPSACAGKGVCLLFLPCLMRSFDFTVLQWVDRDCCAVSSSSQRLCTIVQSCQQT
jgi:hypothetical protein